MTSEPTYRIRDWAKHFENNRTREMRQLLWVPIPTKHDGDGYAELLDHDCGPAHYAAWIACVATAAKSHPRGTLLRDESRPHTPESLARKTRIPAEVFRSALPRLVAIGWLEIDASQSVKCQSVADQVRQDCGETAPRVRQDCAKTVATKKGREGNNKENPPTPLGGDASPISENPPTDVAESGKPKRTRKGPVEAVTIEVLRDTAKLVRWWQFAANCGFVDGTENSRLNVVGVACQVLAAEAVRDPVAVFVATVRDKAWDRIGEAADEQARRRLKDFDAGKRARNASPEIAAALGRLASAKASRATDEDLASYGDGGGDE